MLKRFKKLLKLKKERSYTACISFLESANIANILTGNKCCKTIISVRNNPSRNSSFIHKMAKPIIKLLYNRANGVVALSKGVENDLTRNIGIRRDIATTVYNGFPLENICKLAGLYRTSRVTGNPFTFITTGRCEQQKGQWHLIRTFAEFVKKQENVRLVILGKGPYTAYYQNLIKAYRLDDKIILRGFVSNPFKELAESDVYIFPSLWEGFGNAALEAMACGLPIIASDYRYGAREILAPGTNADFEQKNGVELAEFGIIVPVCSGKKYTHEEPLEPQERLLLEAMERMYTDAELRKHYGEASKKRAQDFSIEKCVEQWQKVIEG